MLAFVDHICSVDEHCEACRDLEGGREWRRRMQEAFTVPAPAPDWECPHSKPWGWMPTARPRMTIRELVRRNAAILAGCPSCKAARAARLAAQRAAK